MLWFERCAVASPKEDVAQRAALDSLLGAFRGRNYDAHVGILATTDVRACLKYLIIGYAFRSKTVFESDERKKFIDLHKTSPCNGFSEDLVRTKSCEKECIARDCKARVDAACSEDPVCSGCTAAAERQKAERELYTFLTVPETCAETRAEIQNRIREAADERRKKTDGPLKEKARRFATMRNSFLASGVPLVVAGSLVFGLSISTGTCYGNASLDVHSDGKMPLCVYPDNYQYVGPSLFISGLGLTVAGLAFLHKKRVVDSEIERPLPKEEPSSDATLDLTCPKPLVPQTDVPPASKSAAQGGVR